MLQEKNCILKGWKGVFQNFVVIVVLWANRIPGPLTVLLISFPRLVIPNPGAVIPDPTAFFWCWSLILYTSLRPWEERTYYVQGKSHCSKKSQMPNISGGPWRTYVGGRVQLLVGYDDERLAELNTVWSLNSSVISLYYRVNFASTDFFPKFVWAYNNWFHVIQQLLLQNFSDFFFLFFPATAQLNWKSTICRLQLELARAIPDADQNDRSSGNENGVPPPPPPVRLG